MTEIATADAADLTCPLCEYNLRGWPTRGAPSAGSRSPGTSCGRPTGRGTRGCSRTPGTAGARSFAVTWWRNRWPWRFWRDVSPANPVSVWRLLVYWALVGTTATVALLVPLPHGYWTDESQAYSYSYLPTPPTGLDLIGAECLRTWTAVRDDLLSPGVIGPPLLVLAWPWLSVAALMLFRLSMRQAKISSAHVLRTAVYGCDLGPAVWVAVVLFLSAGVSPVGWTSAESGAPLAYLALFCGGLATVRLTVAYARYLRFHLPLATVLASQVVVVLFVWTSLALTTDMGRLFR